MLKPSSGRMLEMLVPYTTSEEDRDMVDVIHLCSNNEIKAGLPVRQSTDSGLALSPYDREEEGNFIHSFFRKKGVF